MDKILDIMNGWLTTAVSSGTFEIKQVLLFLFIAGPLALVIWKIRGIIAFVNEVRNSKLNEFQHILNGFELSDEIRLCIKEDMERITAYRVTGISDVARQKIILRLVVQNLDLISVGFFKKFRTFLVIKDRRLIFKKGFSFWFETGMYFLFSLQFLLLAILALILFTYRYEQISVWGHIALCTGSVVMFLFFIAFERMIPRPEECKLLERVLQSQCNEDSD
ncbi:hypothetical protein [Enterobacter sp. Bisph1]|uniref:hypothetical protein n=1 Tax=Enterobacter sp. Bisph1 TaxID=1274399 RepID=UPI00057C0CD1|nr:hypothetical protein [Enterobacter sp. Bisph1]